MTLIGPTGYGKTTLAYQLMQKTTTPELPGLILVMKPQDDTVAEWTKRLGYKIIRDWPPPPSLSPFGRKVSGYVLWPKHTFEPNTDEPEHYRIFRKAILGSYKSGNRIIFADELYSLVNELDLRRELVTLWSKGRSMRTGLWGATQKPTHVPLWAYNQAEHLFLSYEPDKRGRERFAEIGGVDPKIINDTVLQLEKFQWLYIRRDGGTMCIIEKE